MGGLFRVSFLFLVLFFIYFSFLVCEESVDFFYSIFTVALLRTNYDALLSEDVVELFTIVDTE